jgi:hypothetical protein
MEVKTMQCGTLAEPVLYVPYERGSPVVVCYDYVRLIEAMAPQRGYGDVGPMLVTKDMATVGPFAQEALHNVALAVFEEIGVPIWGRAEDAADNVAALIMLNFGTDVALKTILGTTYFLNKMDEDIVAKSETKGYTPEYLGDVRPPMLQRYYNIVCMALGRDLVTFSMFIAHHRDQTLLDFTQEKAQSCERDYKQVLDGFKRTIFDKHVDTELVKLVRGADWLSTK